MEVVRVEMRPTEEGSLKVEMITILPLCLLICLPRMLPRKYVVPTGESEDILVVGSIATSEATQVPKAAPKVAQASAVTPAATPTSPVAPEVASTPAPMSGSTPISDAATGDLQASSPTPRSLSYKAESTTFWLDWSVKMINLVLHQGNPLAVWEMI